MIKDILSKFDIQAFWEAIKLPLRLFVFEAMGFILDFLIQYCAGIDTQSGRIIGLILFTLDKYLHELRATKTSKPLEGWDRGILPF